VDGGTVPWGTDQAIKRIGKVPDVIYHFGDWGKEPMITLLGKTSVDVASIAVKIAKELLKRES
jgi:predicted fused transcriptional regulator/phosphomethylpyrimidine kinase